MNLDRDIRQTELYGKVCDYFRILNGVGLDRIVDAADITASPDGHSVAFTGTLHEDLARAPVTRVCLLELSSRQHTRIQAGEGSDRLPRWSPDGKSLAFISDRAQAGNYQLYLARGDGGEVRAAPAVDGIVEALQWSPDGQHILLLVAGFGADLAGCQGGHTTLSRSGAAQLPAWMPIVDSGDAADLWRRIFVVRVEEMQATALATDGINCWEATWAGNDRIAAVTSDSHSEGSWYRAQLTSFGLKGAETRVLYTPSDQIGVPAGSPSGRAIALIEAVCSDRLIVAGELRLIDTATGEVRAIDTANVDVTHVAWRSDRHLMFVGHRAFETVIGEVYVETGECVEQWSSIERTFGNWYPAIWPLTSGGCVAIGEAYDVAPEIVVVRDGRYDVVASLDARPPGEIKRAHIAPIKWQGRDGLEIHGWLVKPDVAGPMPVVMDIHGGPVWCHRNRWQGRLRGAKLFTDHGIAVFYPNPRGSSTRGREFARLVAGDMGGEDTYDYLTGLDALVANGTADPQRLGVTGISYGGFMSAWLITQDTRFAAAVPISCVSNWYSQHRTSQISYFDTTFLTGRPDQPGGHYFERSPAMFTSRVRTPTLQLTGALDQNTPPTQALEFHRSLLEHDVESVLLTYPTAGHGIRSFPEVLDATTRYVGWFLKYFAAVTR
ncbi:alpha/beta hydrolase family protein [Steroidobacter sp.]|uniref:S9 family peptidase n=1 Tax=Steroidobacter sp. TaxID=1978227 RepID=UPI001A45C9F7|nr:S9 family peptidase [Steroidobacter sp.]MBL8270263.1 S9 family peptidase [Steroidobacter sp.]